MSHISDYLAECDLLVTQSWIYHNNMLKISAIDYFIYIDSDIFATDINIKSDLIIIILDKLLLKIEKVLLVHH